MAQEFEKKRGVESSEKGERGSAKKNQEGGKIDLERKAAEVVQTIEGQEGSEGAEMGDVSESASEDKKQGPVGGFASTVSDEQIEAIRAKLLANLPPQKVMVKQIKAKLYSEDKKLKKEYGKLRKMGSKAAYRLVKVVARIRQVREYFAMLANATFDVVKHLWLKIVHGV